MNNLNEEPAIAELKQEADTSSLLAESFVSEDDLYPGSFFRIPAPPTCNTAWRLA